MAKPKMKKLMMERKFFGRNESVIEEENSSHFVSSKNSDKCS